MATIAAAAPTAGQPASARTPYILEKVVDFSVIAAAVTIGTTCLLYTSPSPRD